MLEVVRGSLDRVCVGALVGRHYHRLVLRQSLDLLLHVATLKRAPVIAPAIK